jgi:hypothetical protein
VLGPFSGTLNNAGEELVVTSASQGTIRSFIYDDAAPWPVAADGTGPSLVLVDPETNPDHAIASNWAASARTAAARAPMKAAPAALPAPIPRRMPMATVSRVPRARARHQRWESRERPGLGQRAVQSFSPDGVTADYLSITFAKPAASRSPTPSETSTSLTLWHSGSVARRARQRITRARTTP